MFPTQFDLWLSMELMVIRVEKVTEVISNFWVIHLRYVLHRKVTGNEVEGKIESHPPKVWMD